MIYNIYVPDFSRIICLKWYFYDEWWKTKKNAHCRLEVREAVKSLRPTRVWEQLGLDSQTRGKLGLAEPLCLTLSISALCLKYEDFIHRDNLNQNQKDTHKKVLELQSLISKVHEFWYTNQNFKKVAFNKQLL